MTKTIIDILNSKNSDTTLKITYGNGETLKLSKNENFEITDDGWLIVNVDKNTEHIKIDSIYKITTIPTKYVYAIIPSREEVSKQILEILSDNKEHKTRDVKKLLVEKVVISPENGKKYTKSKLKEKIDWASSFEIQKLKKSGLIESKRWGYLNITSEGLNKFNE